MEPPSWLIRSRAPSWGSQAGQWSGWALFPWVASKPSAPCLPVFLSTQLSSSRTQTAGGLTSVQPPSGPRVSRTQLPAPTSHPGPGPVWGARRPAASGHGALPALPVPRWPLQGQGHRLSEGGVLILVVGTRPGAFWRELGRSAAAAAACALRAWAPSAQVRAQEDVRHGPRRQRLSGPLCSRALIVT